MITEVLYASTALNVLQLLDGWTTYKVKQFPGGKEHNRVVRWLMDKLGVYTALVLVKGAGITFVWAIALLPLPAEQRLAILALTAAGYIALVVQNYSELLELQEQSRPN